MGWKMRIFLIFSVFIACFVNSVDAQYQIYSGEFKVTKPEFGNGDGERIETIDIDFPESFNKKPQIVLGVNFVDADGNKNLRYDIMPTSISRDGFTVKIITWADTRIYGLKGYWLAYSEQ